MSRSLLLIYASLVALAACTPPAATPTGTTTPVAVVGHYSFAKPSVSRTTSDVAVFADSMAVAWIGGAGAPGWGLASRAGWNSGIDHPGYAKGIVGWGTGKAHWLTNLAGRPFGLYVDTLAVTVNKVATAAILIDSVRVVAVTVCPTCVPGITVERALILTSPAGSGGVLGILTIFDPKLKFRWAHDGAGIAASFDSLGRPAMVAIVTRRQPVDTFGFVTGPMNDTPYGYTFQLQAVAMDSLHKYAPAPTTGVYLTLGVPHLVTIP